MAEGEGASPFNPQQQTMVGNPYFWNRPTQQPKPNEGPAIAGKSIEEGLRGAGEAISGGAQGLTAAYEKGIQNDIYKAVDPLRDQYMEQLHQADTALRPGQQPPDPLGRDSPRDIKQLPQNLNTLDSARANGKLSQTDYDARLNALAKDIRAKYPGFRQYVDEEFKRVTGRDSANQYIRSVIQDIDSFVAQKNAKRDKLESELWSNLGLPGVKEALVAYKGNPDKFGGYALDTLASAKQKDYLDKKYVQDLNIMKDEHGLTETAAKDKFDAYATESGGHFWNITRNWLSMQGGKGDQTVQDLATSMAQGNVPQFQNAQQQAQFTALLNQVGESRKVARTRELMDAAGPSVSQDVIAKKVDEEYKTLWQPYVDLLGKGEFSAAGAYKKIADSKVYDANQALTSNKDFGAFATYIQAVKQIDPNLANLIINSPNAAGIPDRMAAYIATQNANMANPQVANPKTLTQVTQESRVKNIEDGGVYKSPIDLVNEISKKGPDAIGPEAKAELARRAFAPDGSKFLEMFAKDHYEVDQRGNPNSLHKVYGRQSIFNDFTSTGMMDEVYKLGKADPTIWQNYVNWVGNNVTTLLTDHSTTQAPEASHMPRHFAGTEPQEIHADFDDSNSNFTFRMGDRSLMNSRTDLMSLSKNMQAVAQIARKDGADPDAAMLGILLAMNPEPNSLVGKMVQALAMSRKNDTQQ